MPRRSDDSLRVGLNSHRAREQLVEAREGRRAVDEVDDVRACSGLRPGRTSTRTTRRTSSGATSVSAMVVSPPSDMPDDAAGVRGERPDRRGDVLGGGERRAGLELRPAGRVGVAVAGQVDGDERPGAQGHGHGVPGVGVLRAAVEQHELGVALAPHQGAEGAARRDLDLLAAHRGRPVVGQPVLGGVLVEQPELVVGHQRSIAHPDRPYSTAGRKVRIRAFLPAVRPGRAHSANRGQKGSYPGIPARGSWGTGVCVHLYEWASTTRSWTWQQLEAALSGTGAAPDDLGRDGRAPGSPSWNAGGDGPAWTRHRQPFEPGRVERTVGAVRYAELHCHSNFSFLDGASHPEELAVEAARLGLDALALTDHHGFYGVVRFAEAARAVGHADGVRHGDHPDPRPRAGSADDP